MKVLDDYFTHGHSVVEIAADVGVLPSAIRNVLRSAGVSLADDAERDLVSEAACRLGYASFAAWVMAHGPDPLMDQARRLGVSRGVLNRLYDAYRAFLAKSAVRGASSSDRRL